MIYNLSELNGSGISGTITFTERKSGFTLATLNLSGTTTDGDHPAHIHANDIATGGGIIIDLTNVAGNNGMSQTHIEKNNSNDPVSYEDLIGFDGHVKVVTLLDYFFAEITFSLEHLIRPFLLSFHLVWL